MRIVLPNVSYWRLASIAQRYAYSLQSRSWQYLSALVERSQRLWRAKCGRRRELLVHKRYRRRHGCEYKQDEFLDAVQAAAIGKGCAVHRHCKHIGINHCTSPCTTTMHHRTPPYTTVHHRARTHLHWGLGEICRRAVSPLLVPCVCCWLKGTIVILQHILSKHRTKTHLHTPLHTTTAPYTTVYHRTST